MQNEPAVARIDCLHWLKQIDHALTKNPNVSSLLYDRASILRSIGAYAEAEDAYHKLLMSEPENFAGLIELSSLLVKQERYSEALPLREMLLRCYPNDATAIACLAELMLANGDMEAAEKFYTSALELAPHHTLVHSGLARIRRSQERFLEAVVHERASADTLPWYPRQFRGHGDPISLLLMVSEAEGCESTYADRILDEDTFLVTKCIVERITPDVSLPPHSLIFNGITDADRAGDALSRLQDMLSSASVPVINMPSQVRQTNRADMACRLADVAGVKSPRMIELSAVAAREDGVVTQLAVQGFTLPFLVRVPNYHAGRYFEMVESVAAYAQVIATFPLSPILVIEYIDVRGEAAYYHKARVMVIDGELYPTHLAYGSSWKLHYFSSDMMQIPSLRDAEARFLAEPQAVTGARGWSALRRIAKLVQLEYFGIDFACAADGALVVFECNAAMVVAKPGVQAEWAYRRAAYDTVMHAADRMIKRRVPGYEAASSPSGEAFS